MMMVIGCVCLERTNEPSSRKQAGFLGRWTLSAALNDSSFAGEATVSQVYTDCMPLAARAEPEVLGRVSVMTVQEGGGGEQQRR